MLSQLEIYQEKLPVTKGPNLLDKLYRPSIIFSILGGTAIVPTIFNHQKNLKEPKAAQFKLSKLSESTELP